MKRFLGPQTRRIFRAMALALLCAAGLPGVAQAEPDPPRSLSPEEAPLWLAVGPLNVAGNRSCTATLISPTEAITAAHCLFHPLTHHRAAAATIKFVLGQSRDGYAALRGVRRTAILPGYVEIGRVAGAAQVLNDLALLELDQPVPPEVAKPLTVVDWPFSWVKGSEVSVLGYGRDRPYMASLHTGCQVTALAGTVVQTDCPDLYGYTGAPVLLGAADPARMVALVTALVGTRVNSKASVILTIAPHLAELRALLQ